MEKEGRFISCLVVMLILLVFGAVSSTRLDTHDRTHVRELFCIKNNYDGYAKVKVSTTEYSDFCKTNNNLKQFVIVDDEFRFIK